MTDKSPVPVEALPADDASVARLRVRRGFPIGALFLLITVSAVLAAHVMPVFPAVRGNQTGLQVAILAAVAACLFANLLGMVIGLFQSRPWLGLFLGGAIGGAVGLIAGPACVVPEKDFLSMFVASLVGSIMLLVFAVTMRVRD